MQWAGLLQGVCLSSFTYPAKLSQLHEDILAGQAPYAEVCVCVCVHMYVSVYMYAYICVFCMCVWVWVWFTCWFPHLLHNFS